MTPDATLPDGWRWAALGEIANVIMGQSPPSSTYRDTPVGLPFFQGKAEFGDMHPTARAWCVDPRKIAQPGDILISVRAPVGPTNVADVECCIGRGLAAIRGGPEADQDFLLAAIRGQEHRIAEAGSGSTFASISGKRLRAFAIPLPPIAEQRRIVAALEARMGAAERARHAAEAQLATVLALPAALLREAFTDRQTRAQGARVWRSVNLGDVAEYVNGRAFKPSDWETSGTPIVRIQNLTNPAAAYHRFSGEVAPKHKIVTGDLLVAWSASLGVHIWQGNTAILNQHIFKVIEDQAVIDRKYLYHALQIVMDTLKAQSHGATMQHITKPRFEATPIPLPPLDEQRRIVAGLEAGMAAAERARRAAEAQLAAAEALPSAILRRAFAGEAG